MNQKIVNCKGCIHFGGYMLINPKYNGGLVSCTLRCHPIIDLLAAVNCKDYKPKN